MNNNELLFLSTPLERLLVLLGFLFLVAVYAIYPQFDLVISNIFFSSKYGFFNTPFIDNLSEAIMWLERILMLCVFFVVSCTLFKKKKSYQVKKRLLLIMIILILGNGVAVPFIKHYWNRIRPVNTIYFGGKEGVYSSPLKPAHNNGHNASFVSGHAAGGYSLIIFGILSRSRKIWLIRGIIAGLGIGLLRVMQGGHYLSDILFAFFPIWLIMEVIVHLSVYKVNEDVTSAGAACSRCNCH